MALNGPAQVVWVSDTHTGSTTGLSPKKWVIDEENTHVCSKAQRHLLKFWTSFWERRRQDGRPLILVLGGDLTDGYHHGTHQVWTQDELVQVNASVDLLKPAVNLSTKAYLLRGTTAHVGQTGRYDSLVAKELGVPAFYHLSLTVSGVTFDLAHHGPSIGKRIWNVGNVARMYARHIAMDHLLRHERVPQVVIRGHVHRACHETVRDNGHSTEMIVAPAWQLKTEFAHRVATEDDFSDIGGCVIGVCDGRVTDVTLDILRFAQAQVITA